MHTNLKHATFVLVKMGALNAQNLDLKQTIFKMRDKKWHSVPKSKILLLTTGKLGLNGLLISTLWGFRKWPPLNPEKSGLEENRC